MLMVDLAVPRDIEEGAGRLENVYPYDVDDLAQVAQEGRAQRETEAKKAEADELFSKATQLTDPEQAIAALTQSRDLAFDLVIRGRLLQMSGEMADIVGVVQMPRDYFASLSAVGFSPEGGSLSCSQYCAIRSTAAANWSKSTGLRT